MDLESEIVKINLEDIIPNRFQPRLNFDEKALNDLAASIKEHGIIQPLVLRKIGNKYEIIAGERRYKASALAGLKSVPAIISNIDDNTSAEIAIVENIQRKDLTAIEEALSYKKLLDRNYLTQEQLAAKMGLSQSSVANKLRLLNLDETVQKSLLNEQISERHARSLLSLPDKESQKEMLARILNERMTVRQLDSEIKKLTGDNSEEEEIPLVQITPNIEDIKNNATDLNPVQEQKNIENLLKTNQDFSEMVVEQEESKKENKFFNFLEDAPANMDMEQSTEPVFQTPQIEGSSIIEKENEVQPFSSPELDQEISLTSNIFDDQKNDFFTPQAGETVNIEPHNLQKFNTEETVQPEVLDFTNNIEKLDFGYIPFKEEQIVSPSIQSEFQEVVPPVESDIFISPFANDNIVDPVDLIGREDKKERLIDVGLDIRNAITTMRDTIKQLEQKGFYIEIEEIDFEQMYQIIVKIKK